MIRRGRSRRATLHLLVVYEAGLGIDIILESLEHETREVDGLPWLR